MSAASVRAPLPRTMSAWAEAAALVAIAVSFVWLARLFPYSGDDWAWGSQIGLDRLSTFFADYNGRYAGNLAVLALTRSSVADPLVMAATVAAIAFLVLHLARYRTVAGYALVYALVLAMPREVWRQGFVWTSGFSNYALATVFMLAIVAATRWVLTRTVDRPARPVAVAVGLFALTFVGQLFIEHVTLYVVCLAGAAVAYAVWRDRRVSAPLVGLATGAVVGAAVMFSNGAYRRAVSGGPETYQSIGQPAGSRLAALLTTVDTFIDPYAVVLNTALNVALLALVAVLAVARAIRAEAVTRRLALAVVALVGAAGAVAVALFTPRDAAALAPTEGLGLVLLLVLLAGAALLVPARSARRVIIFVAVSLVVLTAPLLVVQPIGPRCFVPSYTLLLLVVAVLARESARELGRRWSYVLVAVAAALAVPTYVVRYDIYDRIDHASAARQAEAREAVAQGLHSVTVAHLPKGVWVHGADPNVEPWITRYKLFYGLPESLQLRVR